MAKRIAVVDADKCLGCQSCMFACARRFGEGGLSRSCIGVRSAGGLERGFVVIVCRACKDPQCSKVCPTRALKKRKGGGVTLVASDCIGCKLCMEACIVGAVFWNEEINKPMICTHCGYCVDFCPHGVLKMEEIDVKE